MLQDEIVLDLIEEIDVIIIDEVSIGNIRLDPLPNASVIVNLDFHLPVIVDLESMAPEVIDPFSRYGKIQRIFNFIKSVRGKKTTFANISFDIHNNIQTIGTADIDPENHNIIDFPITFDKTILAQKITFGQSSFVITNTIQTNGINDIGGVDFYGSGLYGEGIYPGVMGYGDGVYGFGIYPGDAISLAIKFGSVISGSIPYKQTSVGEVSLASHGVPALGTNHVIKIKARTTTGSTGVLRVALYEGAINRSGDLETPFLTNSLAEYSLSIPDNLAAEITDYSNLSFKFWGYDLGGNALVFEVAELYLELPLETGDLYYGAISRQITFGKSVSGTVSSKITPIAEISLGSHGVPSERTHHTIKVRARTTSGSTGVLKAALYEGSINRSGDLITDVLTNVLTDYTLIILDYLAATITDWSNLSIRFWGFDIAGNPLVFEVADMYLELPASTGNTAHYGAFSRGITFTKNVSGIIDNQKTTIAEISLASHGTPSERTNHTIKVRARISEGVIGEDTIATIKAALYEGTTLRSGAAPLMTSSLTGSLTDYSLNIPEAAAATITNYSNLSIRFWGHSSDADALVFEIADMYLELPTT